MIRLNNLTPAHREFYNDLSRIIIVTAGRRSLKSLIGTRKILIDKNRGALYCDNSLYFFAAPTHQQAKQIYWQRLKTDTRKIAKRIYEGDRRIVLLNNSVLQVVGLDKPERIEGITEPKVKAIIISEMDSVKQGAWQNNIRPILSDNNGWAILEGVPEGLDFLYEMALKACNGVIPETKPMLGAHAYSGDYGFHTWHSADVLKPEEIEAVKKEYDEKVFKQEFEGSFVSFGGLAYYAYSVINLTDMEYQKGYPLAIGMDFNIDPMCAVVGHIIEGKFYQFDEIILRHANTYDMCEHIFKKYNTKDVDIFPDSTGKHDSSNARVSDLKILLNFGYRVKARPSNPDQRDRLNVVNSCMKPMSGKPFYYVNPKNCTHTIKDFQKVQRLSDGRLDKEQEEEGKPIVHITDALGYLLFYNFNLKTGGYYAE